MLLTIQAVCCTMLVVYTGNERRLTSRPIFKKTYTIILLHTYTIYNTTIQSNIHSIHSNTYTYIHTYIHNLYFYKFQRVYYIYPTTVTTTLLLLLLLIYYIILDVFSSELYCLSELIRTHEAVVL